jgi:hypothetical protein
MNKLQNWLIGGLIVEFIALGIFVVSRPKPVITERDIPRDNLGALTGPEIPYDYFSFGGVRRFAGHMDFNTASTTLCSIKSPAATSTLIFASAQVSQATNTAIVIDFAKSSIMDATTTKLGTTFSLAANLKSSLIFASSTDSRVLSDIQLNQIFGPNTRFNVKFGGGAGPSTGTHGIGGTCNATFEGF